MAARHHLTLATVAIMAIAADAWPASQAPAEDGFSSDKHITASYRVDVAGLKLGIFKLTTILRGKEYEMRGEGRFQLLQGLLYEWKGSTSSQGRFAGGAPRPSLYALKYKGGSKSGQLRMTFDRGAVTDVSVVPTKKPSPHVVPIREGQLSGVLDPMSAAFLFARSDNPDGDPGVCNQVVPVFDGQHRFDLVLTPKRTEKLQKNPSTGHAGVAAVCQVKFVPISGYRPDNPGIRLMSQTNEIEVWLISLPGTDMYVPYRIVLPTVIGYGSATSLSFEITNGTRRASLN
jgi:hypothetical protein